MSTALLTFLTLCCLAACLVAVYFAVAARTYADQLAKEHAAIVRLDGELAALDGIVKRLRGRVYADEGHGRRTRALDPTEPDWEPPALANGADVDPELQALLALQTAPPVRPGK